MLSKIKITECQNIELHHLVVDYSLFACVLVLIMEIHVSLATAVPIHTVLMIMYQPSCNVHHFSMVSMNLCTAKDKIMRFVSPDFLYVKLWIASFYQVTLGKC